MFAFISTSVRAIIEVLMFAGCINVGSKPANITKFGYQVAIEFYRNNSKNNIIIFSFHFHYQQNTLDLFRMVHLEFEMEKKKGTFTKNMVPTTCKRKKMFII